MTYNEFLSTPHGGNWDMVAQNGPNFRNHLVFRFFDAELLYSEEKTYMLLQNLTIEHSVKIKQIEALSNLDFSADELGSTIKNNSQGESNISGDNKQSYSGYNVEGDYSINTATNTSTASNTSTINSLNKFKETAEFASQEIQRLYYIIDTDLGNIFKQVY